MGALSLGLDGNRDAVLIISQNIYKFIPYIGPLNSGQFAGQKPRAAVISPHLQYGLFWGPIAQLGERLHGMQEVVGSIPIGSTISLITINHSHSVMTGKAL